MEETAPKLHNMLLLTPPNTVIERNRNKRIQKYIAPREQIKMTDNCRWQTELTRRNSKEITYIWRPRTFPFLFFRERDREKWVMASDTNDKSVRPFNIELGVKKTNKIVDRLCLEPLNKNAYFWIHDHRKNLTINIIFHKSNLNGAIMIL